MARRRVTGWAVVILAAIHLESGCEGEERHAPRILPPEQVTIISSDSARIAGTWQPVERSRVVVICVPTAGHTQESWEETAAWLNRAGWSVLRLDLRGEGGSRLPPGMQWQWSPNDTSTAIQYYMEDVRAAVSFVWQKAGRNVKIVLLGADLGGVAALYTAANIPQIAGVALVSPPVGLSKLIARGLGARYGDRPLLIMTELPMEATVGTARTIDTWLGRGSALQLPAPRTAVPLQNKREALAMLKKWITTATL